MRVRGGVALAASAGVLLTLALAGCAPNDDGPLEVPLDEDITCMPQSLYPVAAIGTILTNLSSDELTITEIDSINEKGLSLGTQSLMPSPGDKLLADGYPPTDQFPEQWPLAKTIDEVNIAPHEQHLVLVSEVFLDDGASKGTLDGFAIYYQDEIGNRYVEKTTHGLRFEREKCL